MPKDLSRNVVPSFVQGPSGPHGNIGLSGTDGSGGEDGTSGPSGPEGRRGFIGTTGPTGPTLLITNEANDRVLTSKGSDTVNAESNLTFDGSILTVNGEVSATTLDIGGTDITSTAEELNKLDGSAPHDGQARTLADANRVVINHGGTMRQVELTDFETYFETALDSLGNVTSLGTLTSLTVDNIIIDGTTIGHTSDTDLLTLTSGLLTVAGEVSATTLDIGGTNISATGTEINTCCDSDEEPSVIVIGTADQMIINDGGQGGTMKQCPMTALETFMETNLDTLSNVTSLGTLTSLTVDNIAINGNTISSNNTDGDINLSPNGTGRVNFADAPVIRPKLKDYSETLKLHGTKTSSFNVDFEEGNVHSFQVGGALTVTVTNPPATGIAGAMTLIITHGASSTLTWDPQIDWPGGNAPALSSSGRDVISLLTIDAGTIIYGFVGGINFS